MNWQTVIADIQARGVTLREIAAECGFVSAGHLHDLLSGKQQTCSYERGRSLVALHRRMLRRKVKE